MVVRPSSGASSNPPINGQIDLDSILTDPFKYLNEYIKKKIRNLEKRKGKLDGYKEKLKKGETLTKDQQEAVNKCDEVNGMLSFATELVSHINSVDASAKKERKKRVRRDQLKSESDRIDLVTRALEMFTLMHLTEPDDKIVTPLRERTSFHPSPGAHLNEFAAGTAKLLINLCDQEKEETELFIDDEEGHVKYNQVKEKLELIRPKYNPVPEYGDDGSDFDTPEVDEIEPAEESVQPAQSASDEKDELEEEEEDVELVSDGFENGIETEASSPLVEINGIEEAQNGSEGEEGYVSIKHTSLPDPTGTVPETEIPVAQPEMDEIEFVSENVDDAEMVQIPTTMEFVNREAFGEEDKIKEILVEVSSGFNFLAPQEETDFDQEKELKNELGLSFTSGASGVEFQNPSIEPELDSGAVPVPEETVSFENSNFENNFDPSKMDLKDEPTWQQRQGPGPNGQNGQQRQVYRPTGHTNTSYRNSQRYQRNFENRRPNNGSDISGDQGSHRNVKPMRGHPAQNGGFPKRSNFDSRRGAKP